MKIQEPRNHHFKSDDDFDESLIRAIADSVSNKIILHVKKNPASIDDISKELGVEKTTIQKKVNILLKLCLIEEIDDIKRQGRTAMYQSKIQDIFVEFRNKKLDVKISQM